MSLVKWFNNFTAGEWSPFLDGRADLEKYDYAARTLQNMRVLPYGGITLRPGLQFIAGTKNNAQASRVIPFNFSTSTRFVLEVGDHYVRFFSNGVQVEVASVPLELSAPWAAGELFDIHFKQINDVMYLVHPSYPPYKLSRLTDTSWTLEEVDWTYPPLLEENVMETFKMAISDPTVGTGRTLSCTGLYFNSGMVGSYFELRHLRSGDAVELALTASGDSSTLLVKGAWSVVTTERWYGTLEVQRSTDGGSTWETIRKFKSSADRNVSASGDQIEEALLRLHYVQTGDPYGAGVWTGTAPTNYVKANAKLESEEAYSSGLCKVTAYTDPNTVTVDVLQAIASTAQTDVWSEGAWGPFRGYPRAVGLFEQRLMFGGTATRPTRFWGSRTGDFENFEYGTDDDAAVAFDISAAEGDPIQWIESQQRIQIGTGGREYAAGAGNSEEPLSPANVSVRGQSAYGSNHVQAIAVNDAILFLQRQGRKLREMSYDYARDAYVAPDLTLLAEHITEGGIRQIGFARQPDPTVFGVREDGVLVVCTYDREQNIVAWARYITDGVIESACSVYGSPADEIWCVVRRTINGTTRRYVERFAAESTSKTAARLLDCYATGTLSGPFSGVISGLTHLAGKTVRLVVAGANIGDFAVDSGGSITVPAAKVPTLGTYVVGLPYRGILSPMRLEVTMADGASASRTRRVLKLGLRFKDTLGAKYGPTLDALAEIDFREETTPMDASPPLLTGERVVEFEGRNTRSGTFYVVQDEPLPFTLLGVAVRAEIHAGA